MVIVFNNGDVAIFEQPTEFYYTQGVLCICEHSTKEWYEYPTNIISAIIPTNKRTGE